MTRFVSRYPLPLLAGLALLCGVVVSFSSRTPQQSTTAQGANMNPEERAAIERRGKSLDYPLDQQACATLLQRNPNDPVAHRCTGAYYRRGKKDLNKAIYHWREAVRLEPDNNVSKAQLASTLQIAKRREEAIRVYEQIAATDTRNVGAYGKYLQEDVDFARKMVDKLRRQSR